MLVDAYSQDGCQAGQAETEHIVATLLAFPKTPPHAEPSAEAETSFLEASKLGSTAIRWARKQANTWPIATY